MNLGISEKNSLSNWLCCFGTGEHLTTEFPSHNNPLQLSNSSTTSNTFTMRQPSRRFFGCFNFGSWKKTAPTPQVETIKLLLLGLDNAGKTTLALHLAGESVDDVVSTIGFSKYDLELSFVNQYRLVLYDLGGGARIRGIWKNYFSLVHGLIFMIDSVDIERILEVKKLFNDIIPDAMVSGKPVLIFLNKQDLYGAMDEIDLCKFTNLEELVSKHQCITKIEGVSARNVLPSGAVDGRIERSIQWLVETIHSNWTELNTRVSEASQKQIMREHETMKQRISKMQQRAILEVESQVPSAASRQKVESSEKNNENSETSTKTSSEASLLEAVSTQEEKPESEVEEKRSALPKRTSKIHPSTQ